MLFLFLFLSTEILYPLSVPAREFFTVTIFGIYLLFRIYKGNIHFKANIIELLFIIVFCVIPVISYNYSINRFLSLIGVSTALSYLFFYILIKNELKFSEQINKLTKLSVILIFSVCLYGLFFQYDISGRFRSVYFDPNLLALILVFNLILIYYSKIKNRLLIIFFLLVFLFLTKSLSGILSVCAFMGFKFIVSAYKKKNRKYFYCSLISIFLVISAGIFIRYSRTKNDPYGNKRILIWGAGINAASEDFWFGSGINTFQDKAMKYAFPDRENILKFFKKAHNPHNIFLNIINETGFISFYFFIIFIILLFKNFRNNIYSELGISGFIAYIVHSQFGVSFKVPVENYFLVFFLAVFSMKIKNQINIRLSYLSGILIFLCVIIFMFSAAGQVTIHYAQKFENNNNLKQALKFYETGSELVPENGLVNQRIASVNRFLFYETGDYKYLQNMYENFSSSISKSRANGIYYINNAKAYSEFTGTLNYNEIKFYTAKALALDPYNISLYIDACMIYDNLKKSLTKQKKYITARTGLTVEPLSIRLAEFCSMNNDELEDEFSRRIENLKKFRNARNYYIREINSETLDPVEENYYRILFQMSDN